MSKEFTVDGTGNIVRPGDRVVVRALNWSDIHGPARLLKICSGDTAEVLCDGATESDMVGVTALMREDDTERAGGLPLWHYR